MNLDFIKNIYDSKKNLNIFIIKAYKYDTHFPFNIISVIRVLPFYSLEELYLLNMITDARS